MRWLIAPLILIFATSLFAIDAGGRANHNEEIGVDLPDEQHLRNTGGSDGLGLCVFTSIDHAARYQNVPALIGFRDYMTKHPGGGWPEKVDQYIPKMAASKGYPTPDYVQHTGGDVEFLKLALKTGRYVCVTYDGRDGVFYNGYISHMVNLVHLSDKWAAIHDNNYPGKYLWMTPDQFLSRWRGGGGGWALALLASPPPPIPTSKEATMNTLLMATLLTMGPGQWGSGQCAPVRGVPIRQVYVAAPAYHGWYDGGAGKLELWWNGSKCGTLDPVSAKWQTEGNTHSVDLIQTFGITAPRGATEAELRAKILTQLELERAAAEFRTIKSKLAPPQCICKGDCKCKTCPEGCVASRAQGCSCALDGCGCQNCPADCPASRQDGPRPFNADPFPGGVRADQIPRGNTYSSNGVACSRQRALDVLVQANLTDDRDKAFLTIVGDESMRKMVLADLESSVALAPWKGHLHVNAYASDDWHVRQVGLQPGVTYQAAQKDSNVVPVEFRFRAYAGDVALAEAIRKVDPKYQPDKDPDPLKKPVPPVVPDAPPNKDPQITAPGKDWIPPPLLAVMAIGSLLTVGAYASRRR